MPTVGAAALRPPRSVIAAARAPEQTSEADAPGSVKAALHSSTSVLPPSMVTTGTVVSTTVTVRVTGSALLWPSLTA